jgi:GGDEF domain-containing protein
MKDLRNSVILLLSYFTVVLGIAQVEGFENNILNFQAAFFVMLAVTSILGVFGPSRLRISLFLYVLHWAFIYTLVWGFYWRFLGSPLNFQELGVQFLLVEIAAVLAYIVGQNIAQIDKLLDGLTATTYPNRTLNLEDAHDSISGEMMRSRRYNRPLSVLAIEFEQTGSNELVFEAVRKDILKSFTFAKIGEIINDQARQTDLIVADHSDHFVIVCPETDHQETMIFAERIRQAINVELSTKVVLGAASFPSEALTFDDLLDTARKRVAQTLKRPAKNLPELVGTDVNKGQI